MATCARPIASISADRRVFVQFEQTLERLNVLGGLARLVNNQVSAAMDPF